jgi:DNA-binding MarR family transcriptional regulator
VHGVADVWEALGDRITDAVRTLRRGQPLLQRDLYTVGRRELTAAQVHALELATSRPRWRMHELAAGLGVDQSTATRTVAPLVDLELLTRDLDPDDRRCVVVAVTGTGRRISRTIADRRRAAMRDVVGRMEPERRLLLAELLEEYIAASHEWEQEQRARRSA